MFPYASLLIIHFSPSYSTLTYSSSGFNQKFVAPYNVSGLNVAATRYESSYGNLINVNSLIPTPSPSKRSWSPTGFASSGQYFTGCDPLRIRFLSFNCLICHLTNCL